MYSALAPLSLVVRKRVPVSHSLAGQQLACFSKLGARLENELWPPNLMSTFSRLATPYRPSRHRSNGTKRIINLLIQNRVHLTVNSPLWVTHTPKLFHLFAVCTASHPHSLTKPIYIYIEMSIYVCSYIYRF